MSGEFEFTGYRPDVEDHDSIRAVAQKHPQLMSAREWFEGDLFGWYNIRNQGRKNSCRGHSLGCAADVTYSIKGGAGQTDLDGDGVVNEPLQDQFSTDYCYYEAQKSNNIRGDNGATISGGIPVGKAGVAREVDLPYSEAYSPGRVTPEVRAKATKFAMQRIVEITDADEAFDFVGSGQGCLDWGTVWPLPFVGGCVVTSMSRYQRGGGHATAPATLILGRTLFKYLPALAKYVAADEWLIQVCNSHSRNAQLRGFYFVSRRGMADILRHPMTTCIGWSDMSVPQVRPFDFSKRSWLG